MEQEKNTTPGEETQPSENNIIQGEIIEGEQNRELEFNVETILTIQINRTSQDEIRQQFIDEESCDASELQKQEEEERIMKTVSQPNAKKTQDIIVSIYPQENDQINNTIYQMNILAQGAGNEEQQFTRTPIDVVLLVDNSASMADLKQIKLVRKCLRHILKFLSQKDRICIITFSSHAKVRTGFLTNSFENKSKLKKVIQAINTANKTNVVEGVEEVFAMMMSRQIARSNTCVFLLSDGQDDQPNAIGRTRHIFEQFSHLKYQFFVFGFGADHDPKELMGIAKNKEGGQFFYIEELKSISKYFLIALAGLMTTYAQDLEVTLEVSPSQLNKESGHELAAAELTLLPNQQIVKIKGSSGENMEPKAEQEGKIETKLESEILIKSLKQESKGKLQFLVPFLMLDEQKEILFELKGLKPDALDKVNCQIVYYSHPASQIVKSQFQLSLGYGSSELHRNSIYVVEQNYLLYSGAELIQKSVRVAQESSKHEESIAALKNFNELITNSAFFGDSRMKSLSADILKAIQLCEPIKIEEFEAVNFLARVQRKHGKQIASGGSGINWSKHQSEVIDEYIQGKLDLSDDSCASGFYNDQKDIESEPENTEPEEMLDNIILKNFGENNAKFLEDDLISEGNPDNQRNFPKDKSEEESQLLHVQKKCILNNNGQVLIVQEDYDEKFPSNIIEKQLQNDSQGINGNNNESGVEGGQEGQDNKEQEQDEDIEEYIPANSKFSHLLEKEKTGNKKNF